MPHLQWIPPINSNRRQPQQRTELQAAIVPQPEAPQIDPRQFVKKMRWYAASKPAQTPCVCSCH